MLKILNGIHAEHCLIKHLSALVPLNKPSEFMFKSGCRMRFCVDFHCFIVFSMVCMWVLGKMRNREEACSEVLVEEKKLTRQGECCHARKNKSFDSERIEVDWIVKCFDIVEGTKSFNEGNFFCWNGEWWPTLEC